MMQDQLRQESQARFGPPAAMKQCQGNGAVSSMAYQPQFLSLQLVLPGQYQKIRQSIWLMDQIKVTACLKQPRRCRKQFFQRAGNLLPRTGITDRMGAIVKIGRVGYHAAKASCRKQLPYLAQVTTNAFHSVFQAISGNVPQSRFMGRGMQLHPHNGTVGVLSAQQQAKGTTAGTKIRHFCSGLQADKVTQRHGIRA